MILDVRKTNKCLGRVQSTGCWTRSCPGSVYHTEKIISNKLVVRKQIMPSVILLVNSLTLSLASD